MRFVVLLSAVSLFAQEPIIRTTVPLVLAPTTVTDRHGKTIDGLLPADFEVYDNNKLVRHNLEVNTQPVALVVAVQTSRSAGPALAKIQKTGPMFQPLVAGARGIVAILTYSDKITLKQPFTHDAAEVTGSMRQIEPDGDSAGMHDAAVEATRLFEDHPGFRRVLIVIGESHDRGSSASLQDAVTKLQAANVTVYPVNYSVMATSFTMRANEKFKTSGKAVYQPPEGMNLIAVFTEIGRMGERNGGQALARYTGGEQVSFTKLNGLEKVIGKVADDLHSQYLLSFQPGPSEEGQYHAITVRVKRPDAIVRSRPGYWPE